MKVQPNQVSGILKNSAQLAGILVYGEDWGLVRDRALAAVRGVVGTEGKSVSKHDAHPGRAWAAARRGRRFGPGWRAPGHPCPRCK
jgi:hypothetical protein